MASKKSKTITNILEPNVCSMVTTRTRIKLDGTEEKEYEINPSISGALMGAAIGGELGGPVGAAIGGVIGGIFGPSGNSKK